MVAEATGPSGAAVTYSLPTATDSADPNPTVRCSPASGTTFPLGTTSVTCTATDVSGNSSTATFAVKVQDTTPPMLSSPANITRDATSDSGAMVSYSNPTPTDAVDSSPTVSCSPASGSTFPIGITTVVCTATDARSNSSQAAFTITVLDTPTLIAGKVTQVDGITPIAGAVIQVYEGAVGVGTATTNSSGDYGIEIPPSSGTGPSSELINISTRAYVETGNGLTIAGFIIEGTDPMTVLIRTTGPGLAASGVTDVLSNPNLQLYSGQIVAQNDDWQTTDPLCAGPVIACGDAQDIIATGLAPTGGPLESALLVTLPPGLYSALMRGASSDPTGIGLIEVFDIAPASSSKLVNISTRAYVKLGEGGTIAEFIIQGNDLMTVLIRTTGPGLAAFGLSDVLPDPDLKLYSGQTVVAQNDDWQTTDPLCAGPVIACGDAQDIIATGLDPCAVTPTGCTLESALLVTLPPGTYTAQMRGAGSDPTGIGLIGVFDRNFTDLSAGRAPSSTYTVLASAAGYATQNRTGVTVTDRTTTTVDFGLGAPPNTSGIGADGWSPKVRWVSGGSNITGIHLSLLPDGNLLALGPKTFKMVPTPLGQPLPAEITVTDMSNQVPYEVAGDSLYCSGHTLLEDGVFFAAGGISGQSGLPYAVTYNNNTLGLWTRIQNYMAGLGDTPSVGPRRWYPAVTRLADSRVLVTAGRDYWWGFTSENRSVEIFDPASATWSLVSSHSNSPQEIFNFDYSHVFQLPGQIGGSDVIMFGEDGYPVLFSTSTGAWNVRPAHRPPGAPVLSNFGTSSVMLPIRVNDGEWGYSNGSILMASGSHYTDYEQNIDIYDPVQNSWLPSVNMGIRRHHPSTVLLPDGRILMAAGHNDNSIPTGYAQYIDPINGFKVHWSQSAFSESRGYHTVTLLLPDGRVLVGGGNDGGTAGNEKTDFRYFYPDYFDGPRPQILSFPAQLDYNSPYMVTWQSATPVSEAVLMGVGSMTHSIDFNQRYIQLRIQDSTDGSTTFLAPPNSMVAPPGYYLLFILDQDRRPSIGKIVQLR
jgi:hypothetical protein